MLQLRQHFQENLRAKSDHSRQSVWFIKAREGRERREQIAERSEDDFAALGAEVIMATSIQIQHFEAKLDSYDSAVVEALMINQEKIVAVQARIDLLLDQAYVIDDGRRVFKTEDGTKVFDEHGVEVSEDELDPSLFDDSRPSWELFSAENDELRSLEAERQGIFEYEERLDAARDQLEEGDISENDLEELDAELADLMPDAVREHVPGMKPKQEDTLQVEPNTSRPAPVVSAGLQTIGVP